VFELARHALQVVHWQTIRQFLSRLVTRLGDDGADACQGVGVRGIGVTKLVDEQQQHVQFAHRAEAAGDASQAAIQLARGVGVELQHRHDLAQTARRHPGAMQRAHIALIDAREHSGKAVEAGFE
jgi:uncharacterized protein YggE